MPLALDGRWSAATWALEGAALVWVGCRQGRLLPRAFGALLQIAGGVIFVMVVLATWIHIAVAVKRYHDRNKSGWWVLIVFLPVIGGLWYLIECGFLRGTPGPNTYGPDPLAAV